jgi:A/G-specific adenine glycosylase
VLLCFRGQGQVVLRATSSAVGRGAGWQTSIRRALLRWYRVEGRHELPWRNTRDPWFVLLAELMLQRTRADLVVPVFENARHRFPNAAALADAEPNDVARALGSLGLSHRIPRIQAAANAVRSGVPTTLAGLLQVPGVGPYAAHATLCFAFGRSVPIIDPSVLRILERLDLIRSTRSRPRSDPATWAAAKELLPSRSARDWNYALLDLGSAVCTPIPRCFECPLRAMCPHGQWECTQR